MRRRLIMTTGEHGTRLSRKRSFSEQKSQPTHSMACRFQKSVRQLQCDALKEAGCAKVFADQGVSGTAITRPGLNRAMRTLKRGDTLVVWKLDRFGRAILNAPNLTTRLGIRDRAMLHLCFACGLRVSELVGLPLAQVSLHRTPSIRVFGKGRKERSLPLWNETATDLRAWLAVRRPARVPELFVNAEGAAMTRAGFEYILDKRTRAAATGYPGLVGRSVSPHQLRHSCAILMLEATRDIRKVALWLGHADNSLVLSGLAARSPPPSHSLRSPSQSAPVHRHRRKADPCCQWREA